MFKQKIMKGTFNEPEWEYTVYIAALSTSECQKGVPSKGGGKNTGQLNMLKKIIMKETMS